MGRRWGCVPVLALTLGCGSSGGGAAGDGGLDGSGSGDAPGSAGDDGSSGVDGSMSGSDGGSLADGAIHDGGGTASDGAAHDSGGPMLDAAGSGDGGSAAYSGTVTFQLYTLSGTTYSYITVGFQPGTTSKCAVGACCYVAPTVGDAGAPIGVSAGTVATNDNNQPLQGIPFGPQGYVSYQATGAFWLPLDTMQAYALGATVQAFNGGVVQPEHLAGLSPPTGATAHVSLGSGLAVAWTPGGASGSRVVAQLVTASSGSVECVADEATGQATFSPSALGHFSATGTATLVMSRATVATTQAANASIVIQALASDGVPVQFGP